MGPTPHTPGAPAERTATSDAAQGGWEHRYGAEVNPPPRPPTLEQSWGWCLHQGRECIRDCASKPRCALFRPHTQPPSDMRSQAQGTRNLQRKCFWWHPRAAGLCPEEEPGFQGCVHGKERKEPKRPKEKRPASDSRVWFVRWRGEAVKGRGSGGRGDADGGRKLQKCHGEGARRQTFLPQADSVFLSLVAMPTGPMRVQGGSGRPWPQQPSSAQAPTPSQGSWLFSTAPPPIPFCGDEKINQVEAKVGHRPRWSPSLCPFAPVVAG